MVLRLANNVLHLNDNGKKSVLEANGPSHSHFGDTGWPSFLCTHPCVADAQILYGTHTEVFTEERSKNHDLDPYKKKEQMVLPEVVNGISGLSKLSF